SASAVFGTQAVRSKNGGRGVLNEDPGLMCCGVLGVVYMAASCGCAFTARPDNGETYVHRRGGFGFTLRGRGDGGGRRRFNVSDVRQSGLALHCSDCVV